MCEATPALVPTHPQHRHEAERVEGVRTGKSATPSGECGEAQGMDTKVSWARNPPCATSTSPQGPLLPTPQPLGAPASPSTGTTGTETHSPLASSSQISK